MEIVEWLVKAIVLLVLAVVAVGAGCYIGMVLMIRKDTGRWRFRLWDSEVIEAAIRDYQRPAHQDLGIEPDHFAKLERGEIELTFDCMVCGRVRPDHYIEVHYRPIVGLEDWFPEARVNVRYCVDNPVCERVAKEPGPWDSAYEQMKRGDR